MPDRTRSLRHAARATLAAGLLAATLLPPAAARAQSSQAGRDARRAEMESRQRALRELEKLKTRTARKEPDRRPAYRDVAEDFQQLQLVNYSLAGAALPDAPLDYARIRKESAEVRKRASRLKGYLMLPEPGAAEKQGEAAGVATPEALRSAVAALDALVNSFVWNPVFQKPGVVDLEQSSKAGRDLARIIILSEQIRRGAEELARGAGKD